MAAEAPAASLQYKTVTVKPGQTVFSIIGNSAVPADKIAEDFEALNPNVKASRIQAGITYKFVYKYYCNSPFMKLTRN